MIKGGGPNTFGFRKFLQVFDISRRKNTFFDPITFALGHLYLVPSLKCDEIINS